MSDREFENYLTLIGRLLRLNSAQREAIGEELRDHFESRWTELTARGVPHDEAVRRALEEFGDAAGLAAQFSRISSQRKRRMIMRCTVASVGLLAAALIVATSIWPEHRGAVIGKAVAESNDKGNADIDKSKLEKLEKAAEELPDDLNAASEAKLKRFTVADFNEPIPLKDFLERVGEKFDLEVVVDAQSLKDAGVDPDATLVSKRLKHVRGSMLLNLVLGEFNLGYTIRDGIVIVASKDKLGGELVTKVYDCSEILASDIGQFQQPDGSRKVKQPTGGGGFAVADNPQQSAPAATADQNAVEPAKAAPAGGGGGGVGAGAAHSAGSGPKPEASDKPMTPTDELIDVITNVVEPETWSEMGGNGRISGYGGLLIVSQTSEVHTKIAELLNQMQSKLAGRSAK